MKKITFLISIISFLVLFSDSVFAQREAQEVRYGSRWQIKMMKDKFNYSLIIPSEKERQTYESLLRNNHSTVMYVENMLQSSGLPKMLRNLVMIESGFRNSSVSSANAVGIWQVTPINALTYGLDEKDRGDVSKSTRVAVRTLKDLYVKYRNWITVIAAYNCGGTNVDRAITRAGSDKYHEFYKYLPDETINHVNKFMTACYITNELSQLMTDYKERFPGEGDKPSEAKSVRPKRTKPNNDPTMMSVDITSEYKLDVLVKQLAVSPEDLQKWSPDLKDDLAKYGAGTLFLPISKMAEFHSRKSTILKLSQESFRSRALTN
ncbi:MAG: lytic transglycosylase domain-containing protein [Dysgonamonadaceae bacterium]